MLVDIGWWFDWALGFVIVCDVRVREWFVCLFLVVCIVLVCG